MVSNLFYFHPYLGKWSNLTNIFQTGWNHHLDECLGSCLKNSNPPGFLSEGRQGHSSALLLHFHEKVQWRSSLGNHMKTPKVKKENNELDVVDERYSCNSRDVYIYIYIYLRICIYIYAYICVYKTKKYVYIYKYKTDPYATFGKMLHILTSVKVWDFVHQHISSKVKTPSKSTPNWGSLAFTSSFCSTGAISLLMSS